MSTNPKIVGIDVSKATLDCFGDNHHIKVDNNPSGFKEMVSAYSNDHHYVMEGTGAYSIPVADFLYNHGILVSVVHAKTIKYFGQYKGIRTKTDKADAKLIQQYGEEKTPPLWTPLPEWMYTLKALSFRVDRLLTEKTACKNQAHSLKDSNKRNPKLKLHLKRSIKYFEQEIEALRFEMNLILKERTPQLLANLQTIPGIGRDTAVLLILYTNCFTGFSNVKELASYLGLAPTQNQSGTSLKGSGRISKAGNPRLRKQLYMAAVASVKCNPHCKALFERLKAKNKNGIEATVAVSHKLLKYAYGVAKNNVPYDLSYKSTLKVS